MDTSKILIILCVFLLAICLTLSLTAVASLRAAMTDVGNGQERVEELAAVLENCVEELQTESDLKTPEELPSMETDVLYNRFCVRESNGKIAVYTGEGYLVRVIETNLSLLPPAERKLLKEGICVNSWKELLSLIQNYES